MDTTWSNWDQIPAQVDIVKLHFTQSARDNIAALDDLNDFQSTAANLKSIDSLLDDSKYLFPVADRVDGGVGSPNPTKRKSNGDNAWLVSTLPPGGTNPVVYVNLTV